MSLFKVSGGYKKQTVVLAGGASNAAASFRQVCIEMLAGCVLTYLLQLTKQRILFLARVCNSLCEFCPSLVLLLNGLRKLDPPRGVADGR